MNAPTVCQWEACRVTWWLYYNGKPLTGIRGHITLTPEQVRVKALGELAVMPGLAYPGRVPFEMAQAIIASEVTL